MRSVLTIDVEAPPELVLALVVDVTRWPALFPHYVSVRKRTLTKGLAAIPPGAVFARYVAVRLLVPALGLGVPIAWRSLSWPDRDGGMRFRHAGGVTDGMDVHWSIEPAPSGCRVTIEHVFKRRLPIPLLGPLAGDELVPALVDRFVIRPIAARTLSTVRALAGVLARDAAARDAATPARTARDAAAVGSPPPSTERKESHAAS